MAEGKKLLWGDLRSGSGHMLWQLKERIFGVTSLHFRPPGRDLLVLNTDVLRILPGRHNCAPLKREEFEDRAHVQIEVQVLI